MRIVNLGIVAHVDAGKTSLTERLLYAAGVIDEVGSVDDGSTQTDSLALERERGITIKAAVVSFAVGDVTVNLIDTPGHPDFIAEVERALRVLDGAVLVVSAVEGVQAQTVVLMRALHRLRVPTLIFVNKIDRGGAQYEETLHSIAERLTPAIIPMGSVSRLGTRGATVTAYGDHDPTFGFALVNALADRDDALLAAYVADEGAISYRRLRDELARQTRRTLVHPVYFGSAITGAGVESLIGGITDLLPAAPGESDGPVSGTVFKVDRGPAGEKVAHVRLFSGTIRLRDRVVLRSGKGPDREAKVTAISLVEAGAAARRANVAAGQIARLWGLHDVQIGDTLGVPPARAAEEQQFSAPSLETVVVPVCPADKGRLHLALTQLAEQDPLINLRQDDVRQELSVSLYGEVQKEVIQATLANEFGIDVAFRRSTTLCIERPNAAGAAVEIIDKDPNPFLATVGLRIEPAAVGSGVEFRLGVELGSMPLAFFKAVEESIDETLRQGLYGWQVTDCIVTMTHSGYWPRQSHAHGTFDKSMSSTAGDFRNLTPLVLMDALKRAGTTVYEPIYRFVLEAPGDLVAPLLSALADLAAIPRQQAIRGRTCTLDGEIPAARMHELQQRLPSLTRGEGVLDYAFNQYRQVRGVVPVRARSDHNPLNREEYLLHVVRRVGRV